MTQPSPAIPRRRTDDLATRIVGSETLVYDRTTDRAHSLPEAVAAVWDRCDGSTPIADVAAALGLGDATIHSALLQLADAELLVQVGASRRQFLSRAAIVGGGSVVVPVLSSIAAPKAFASASSPVSYPIYQAFGTDPTLNPARQYTIGEAPPVTANPQIPVFTATPQGQYSNGTSGTTNNVNYPNHYGEQVIGANRYPFCGPDTGVLKATPGTNDLVIKFTAPIAGALSDGFAFTSLDTAGGTIVVKIVAPTGFVTGTLTPNGTTAQKQAILTAPAVRVAAGDAVYLVVNGGGDSTHDTTGIGGQLTITP